MMRPTRLLAPSILSSILLLLIACGSNPENLNELPMYGERPQNEYQQALNEEFVREVIEKAGSPEAATERALQLGWQHMSKGDWRTATKRFNQAWLLTPESADVYWGFAAAMGLKDDYEESIRFFRKAVEIEPTSAPILCDFAFTYIRMGTEPLQSQATRSQRMDEAISLLDTAIEADPKFELTYFNYALARFYRQDYPGAWEMVAKAEVLGGRSLEPAFIKDLTSNMPRPQKQVD